MTAEVEKAVKRLDETKDPVEKAHIKSEIDMMPLSSGELDQVKEREHNRKANDIKVFHEQRKH
ncbi:hypothetical protein LCGC14_0974570 [marine sediment metagenome]|uniref:Uncharacterized protein n=1 Tax=marine sediment metagenome TaxID=412755 RepID=A0A0F9NWT8_9ZZZZ